ncbi:hypothetical protein PGT21_016361 [Puccinia graminis f. sp. tritici]|uniref:Uncharacterized protein n=1 Tax=Puccinia graminis f. sp. tritici TaxID=56615 RepID=A0A5B0LVC6_PUCGR|nr:hypothetical protein PGT21_016361 [Puccinia graminis f. sp. tritici]
MNSQEGFMLGDWKSLRDNLYQFSGVPPSSIWSEQDAELHNDGIFYQNKLLNIIEDSEPLFLKKQVSIKLNTYMKEQECEEMNQRCKKQIVQLLGLIVGMRTYFQSYKFGEQVRSKILPLSGKNILQYWYYFPFMDMFEGLGEEYYKMFSTEYTKILFQYYENFPDYWQNQMMRQKIIAFGNVLLNEHDDKTFKELIHMFTDACTASEHEVYPTELMNLFLLIENQKINHPERFERLQEKPKDFEEKFDLMSSSTQYLASIEKLQIYLKKSFQEFDFEFSFPLFYGSAKNIERSEQNIEELRIFAHHLKRVQSDYLKQRKPMIKPENPLYMYSLDVIITAKINNMKGMIIKSTKYYEDYLSKSSKGFVSSALDTFSRLIKDKKE